MAAEIIDGKAVAKEIAEQISQEAAGLRAVGREVRLVAVLVGHDEAAKWYANMQARRSESVGIQYQLVELPGDTTQDGLLERLGELNDDPEVSAVILQMPLPKQIDAAVAQKAIAPAKDAEGVHPENLGRLVTGTGLVAPCTPMAAMELLQRACPELSGKEAVVVGRSTIVGKPIALMLEHLSVSATVTVCHSRTKDLASHTRRAEVLVAATGLSQSRWDRYCRAKAAGQAVGLPDLGPLITGEMVSEGTIVIDVATNYIPKGFDDQGEPLRDEKNQVITRTVGDVDFEAVKDKAAAITPVPGGVGPVTVTMLLRNALACAKAGV
ncbi:MAG TPA: bifunctional 5,10-methylenetetrahydrofolate dehydrogenase/5,10-methenyltetrahydrofolate cyclohydrolase [Phycisphaerae bacterium]|nr:bifunctional 5,10-methylenetetrahydrofolate dehydrogenase/5,10-methenyltetrahydrofolate cyclohydrolase [Phycisphaerae bacterium]